MPVPLLIVSMIPCAGITAVMASQSGTLSIRLVSTFCATVVPLCWSATNTNVETGSSGMVLIEASDASLPSRSYSSMRPCSVDCTSESSV